MGGVRQCGVVVHRCPSIQLDIGVLGIEGGRVCGGGEGIGVVCHVFLGNVCIGYLLSGRMGWLVCRVG